LFAPHRPIWSTFDSRAVTPQEDWPVRVARRVDLLRGMKLATALLALSACAPHLASVRAPTPVDGTAVTALWASEIRLVARDGDWLIASAGDEPTSAAMYDARGLALEASGPVPLEQLVATAHAVIVVRPANMTADDEAAALARARTDSAADGATLVYRASQTEARTGAHAQAITPAELMQYGEVIYWSGPRE